MRLVLPLHLSPECAASCRPGQSPRDGDGYMIAHYHRERMMAAAGGRGFRIPAGLTREPRSGSRAETRTVAKANLKDGRRRRAAQALDRMRAQRFDVIAARQARGGFVCAEEEAVLAAGRPEGV